VTEPLLQKHTGGATIWAVLLLWVLIPSVARAQDRTPALNLTLRDVRFDLPDLPAAPRDPPRRACPGCPVRRIWRPYLESLALNVMYNGINHARAGSETADVSPRTWLANLQAGFEWDHNRWVTNQFGHPYQGSNYFTSGRAHGLSFWESTAVAAFGSGTWEYFYENNRASFNDLINTTVGGTAIGEVLYRMAWAIRDPARGDGGRHTREWAALAIDPLGGLERITSGDRHRIMEKPDDVAGRTFTWRATSGTIWQGATNNGPSSAARPFLDFDLHYGDVRTGRSTTPFEAFTAQMVIGGGPLTQAAIHGRLFGKPFGRRGNGQVTIFQIFDFVTNPAYAFGGQGFEVEVGRRHSLGSGATMWMAGSAGGSIRAAADTLIQPPAGVTLPAPIDKRRYDYGPGARFGGTVEVTTRNLALASVSYQAYQVSVVDGRRAVHLLQRVQAEVRVPLRRDLAVGAAAEYFYREAYFWGAGSRTEQSPQLRVFLSWGLGR